jgi:pimeloyl-ACP methyl ester carboxylesterase
MPKAAEFGWVDRAEYPFRSHYLPTPYGDMHYVDEGSGEVLLFVHGNPTCSFMCRHLIRGLSGRYCCVAPDHIGFGLSAPRRLLPPAVSRREPGELDRDG